MVEIMNKEKTKTYKFKIYGLVMEAPVKVIGLKKAEPEHQVDVTVIFQKLDNLPIFKKTYLKRKGLDGTLGWHQNEPNSTYLNWGEKITFKIIGDHTIIIDTEETDLDFISLFLNSEAIGFILFNKGYLLIHASAITLPNGKGVLFMGHPGDGKSTTTAAFVKQNCNIIADDMVAITFIDDKPYFVPSFPQIKIWETTVRNLNYQSTEIKPIIEGQGKYAYYNEDLFDEALVPLDTIYNLGADKEEIQLGMKTSMDVFYHCSLPDEEFLKGEKLKNYFILCTKLKNFPVHKKPKFENYEILNDFVTKTIAESN